MCSNKEYSYNKIIIYCNVNIVFYLLCVLIIELLSLIYVTIYCIILLIITIYGLNVNYFNKPSFVFNFFLHFINTQSNIF